MAVKYVKEAKGTSYNVTVVIESNGANNIELEEAIEKMINDSGIGEVSWINAEIEYVNESEDVDPETEMSDDEKILTEKPGKIYKSGGWNFRYDDKENKLILIDPEDGSEVDSMGLNRDDWKENPQYWCDTYADSLESEISNMDMSEFTDGIWEEGFMSDEYDDDHEPYSVDGDEDDQHHYSPENESIEDYSDDPIEIIDVTSTEPKIDKAISDKVCPMCGNSVDLCTCEKEESLIPNIKVKSIKPICTCGRKH